MEDLRGSETQALNETYIINKLAYLRICNVRLVCSMHYSVKINMDITQVTAGVMYLGKITFRVKERLSKY